MKKAEIWISAVLYMALGVIILTIVLATSLPVVNKLKDKNTIIQSKNIMAELDQNIRALYTEGPGSQRPIEISINRGIFEINNNNEEITWILEDSRYIEVESGAGEIKEGNIYISTEVTQNKNKYKVKLRLSYKLDADTKLLDLDSDLSQITGRQTVLLRNKGGVDIPVIEVVEL